MQDCLLIKSTSLPLLNDNGAGLAIAVSTYFDDVSRRCKKKDEDTPSKTTKEEVKANFGWLPQVPDITKNLKNAFNLWDAVSFKQSLMFWWMALTRFQVYLGSKEVDKEVKNAKAFEEANAWLSAMR